MWTFPPAGTVAGVVASGSVSLPKLAVKAPNQSATSHAGRSRAFPLQREHHVQDVGWLWGLKAYSSVKRAEPLADGCDSRSHFPRARDGRWSAEVS